MEGSLKTQLLDLDRQLEANMAEHKRLIVKRQETITELCYEYKKRYPVVFVIAHNTRLHDVRAVFAKKEDADRELDLHYFSAEFNVYQVPITQLVHGHIVNLKE